MASSGSGKKGDRDGSGGSDGGAKESVADLLLKLNLTEAEEAVLEFSDDDGRPSHRWWNGRWWERFSRHGSYMWLLSGRL
jgi:hypothetical protein